MGRVIKVLPTQCLSIERRREGGECCVHTPTSHDGGWVIEGLIVSQSIYINKKVREEGSVVVVRLFTQS